jgi:hypothetical protein
MALAPTGAPTTKDGQWLDEYAELVCFRRCSEVFMASRSRRSRCAFGRSVKGS